MLQGYLTGQLASALGTYQVEALRREFKSFTDIMEKSMKTLKEEVQADIKIKGCAGGSWYEHPGAAVDPLCLPRDPEWGVYTDGTDGVKAYVFGAEYQTYTYNSMPTVHDHDVPCAVCLVRDKSLVKMFPARKSCYKGWKLEYKGYLMAGYYAHTAGSMYTCVDGNPDILHGGKADKNGKLFFLVEARCGSLKCPPYVEGREIVCAVCSKE
uniref:Uncharacterized protein LOC111105053 n=1 Tax=Crassostrea virginica TaxID=6565 RepID=A0A8B8AXB1_CRAVI|nr:uncharacterized protein LOC111105053 [Crassostrea virginica]